MKRVGTYKYLGLTFFLYIYITKLDREYNVCAGKKGELENLLLGKSGRVNSDMLVILYNAVICSIIIFGSVCWVGNISKFYRGRLENMIKQDMGWESHWTERRLYNKLMQI